jgi:hypothetical protein
VGWVSADRKIDGVWVQRLSVVHVVVIVTTVAYHLSPIVVVIVTVSQMARSRSQVSKVRG